MRRQNYDVTVTIDGETVATITKYAHNSALRAGTDALRDHAAGSFWERDSELSSKSDERTQMAYRNGDRIALVTVTRPA